MSMPQAPTRISRPQPAPPPLPHELARPHLVAALSQRWSLPVTCIVAGAGFGKTTLLAQAVRCDAVAPPGIDGWVSCDTRHAAAAQLARAIIECTGSIGVPSATPLVSVVEALRAHAPLDVCLVLDDVHLLGDDSSGARLLAGLVSRLPTNVHLVLAGRRAPPVPLARLRAAARVLELTERELCFTPTEVERLASRLDRPAQVARSFGGWPALVRVALAARPGSAHGFVREEVLAELDEGAQRDLLALSVVGTADAKLVGEVTRSAADLDALADRVPLVSRLDDERFHAHDLWRDALRRALDPDLVAGVERRAVDALLTAGDVARAGDVAIRAADWPALGRAALELVRTTISVLPVDLAARWLGAAPSSAGHTIPELRLLEAAHRAAVAFRDATVDVELDAVASAFRERHDPDAEVAALAVATVAAQSRGDTSRLVALAVRTAEVPGAEGNPIVRLAACSIAGVVAEMSGDPEAAVEHFAAAPLDDVPPALALSANRFLMHALLLAGRADDAVALADRALSDVGSEHSRAMPAFTRWLAGDPNGFTYTPVATYASDDMSDRDAFVAGAFQAVIRASWGETLPLRHWAPTNARDAAVLANARAALAVVVGDEAGAAATFDELLARHGDDRVCDRHLRRFLELGYVLAPALRDRWDQAMLGPSHERARDVARALVDLRAGRPPRRDALLEPPHVFTVLPLPWSVELAARLEAHRSPRGALLFEWLLERVGCAAHRALRHAAASPDECLAAGAAALLARVPKAPAQATSIGVLGPLLVQHGDEIAVGGELRRQRVRELLAMLVVEETVARDRIIDALWPEHDIDAGGRNLRVTLTYLRRLLEPDRPAGEANYHVRTDAVAVRLVRSPHLRVDLWELRRLTSEAAVARAAGHVERAIHLLTEATDLWRGSPLTDLDRIEGFEAAVEEIRLLQTQSLLDLGELQLTVGDTAGALGAAERALALEPYLEAAHRLAIAACIHRGDQTRTLAAIRRAHQALDDLGVTPEPATAMLLRAATRDRHAVALAS
jgi:DNA-binding SARP family transcriptional activator